MVKSVLITGANAGLGKDCARQLALLDGVERVYLGCRNESKARAALRDLEETTGKSIFEIVQVDTSDLKSVRAAVASLPGAVDGLVMNAGGVGGSQFNEKTVDGVSQIFAVNLLGHVVLAEELLKAGKLTGVAVYAGSEAVRGVPEMGIKQFPLKTSSVDEFATIADGTFYGDSKDPMAAYGLVKYMAALWMSTLARKHPGVRFVTMSPGATTGTEALSKAPGFQRIMFTVMFQFMLLMGKVHRLEVGAKRYVDALTDESFKSGVFYASQKGVTGPVGAQSTIFADLNDTTIQDNASEAIHRFIR